MQNLSSSADAISTEVDPQTMVERYQRAQDFLHASAGRKQLVANATITPYWIQNSDCFWYIRERFLECGALGTHYRIVDASTQSNTMAFDHQALAKALAAVSNNTVDADNLPLSDVQITLSPTIVRFTAFETDWEYTADEQCCQQSINPKNDRNLSPDGRFEAFIQAHNIWLREIATGKERALTTEGERFFEYGNGPAVTGKIIFPLVDLRWSPDGRHIMSQRIDTRQVRQGLPLVEHVPDDGLSPRIVDEGRHVAMLGDKTVDAWELLSIDVETGATQLLDHKPFPMNYPPYLGYFIAGRAWWDQDNRHAYAIYQDTARTNTHLLRWDTETGESRVLFKEDADTRAILGDTDKKRVMATPLPHSDEVVWFSERSGWAHLYLYDLKTGECKNAITQGAWLVRDILKLDEVNRELWIKTAGRIDHHNPYHTDICRVNIDTGHLTPLTASDHEYSAFGPKDFLPIYQTLQSVSPGHRFVVTTRSRVDERPVSVLLNREGETLCTVETADLSRMPGGWQFPDITETVAEDGETNIYGMMFKPSNFSADKSYPVLDFSFVMMADPVAAFGSGMNAYLYCEAAAYAELGFIVVKFFNRGLAGYREKAFHDHVDHSLPFYNLADNAASIKQLTTQHAYMDYQRVGITLHSSFPTALTGLFIYPDVYKVGVTYNAMTDARLLPLEDEMGGADFPQLEAFAKNLQGKLLMIAGMMDYCVPVSSTFRIVEALKKENKNFDMLILPNLSHADDGYAIRRQWDYLVTHLLGVDPPENVELTL